MWLAVFGVFFLNLFGGSTSHYQWRCSPLDTVNNRYYLPDFGGRGKVSGYQWEPSISDTTYIYSVDTSTLNCNGTVTAVEFCYRPSNTNRSREVFTLQILRLQEKNNNNNSVKVNKSVTVRIPYECNRNKCCNTMALTKKDQFKISEANFFVGVAPKRIPSMLEQVPDIPGLCVDEHPEFTTRSYRTGLINGNQPVSLGEMKNQTLRLMWLHITPFLTGEQSGSPTTTSMLQNTPSSTINQTTSSHYVSSPASIAGGTIGSVILILIIVTVSFLLVLYMIYRKKNFKYSEQDGAMAINNIIYSSEQSTVLSKPEYDYSDVGPSTGACEKEAEPTVFNGNKYTSSSHATDVMSSSHPEYDDIYTVPADNVVCLYEQLDTMVTDDVTRYNIVLGNRLGSGQFGDVFKGVWERRHDTLDVAVKALKEGSSEDDKVKFLQEAAIMAQFKHHNVVTMYGLVKDGEPVLLILEMLEKGDLRNYLLSMKTNDGGVSPEIDGHELLSYCRQVASGMVYLSNKAFVHRDLAARNILVSDDRICKITDFGMSRDLADENYYVSHGGLIPVKWTAPEALFYKKYSTASDVWSFGAVMYEIWSIGHKPFENMQNSEVIKKITAGYRLPPPPGCPHAIYSIMISCWHPEASGRPHFNDLSTQLSVSNSKLLHVEESDFMAAYKLGADLSSGQSLYTDLQNMYKK